MAEEEHFNLRKISDDVGRLVEKNPDSDHCQGCIHEQEEGVVSEYSDWCCCEHGEVYAKVYKGEVSWVTDDSRRLYEANRALRDQGGSS